VDLTLTLPCKAESDDVIRDNSLTWTGLPAI
jgi:hypothetical protein